MLKRVIQPVSRWYMAAITRRKANQSIAITRAQLKGRGDYGTRCSCSTTSNRLIVPLLVMFLARCARAHKGVIIAHLHPKLNAGGARTALKTPVT